MNEDNPLIDGLRANAVTWEMNLLLPENECVHGALPNEPDAPCGCFRVRVAA